MAAVTRAPVVSSPPAGHEGDDYLVEGTPLSYIGHTPLLRLKKVTSGLAGRSQVWAKAEYFNPGGSVKDRAALSMVREAIRTGKLGEGRILLDASSGNTGIAYALMGAVLEFPVEIVLPANASPERKRRILAYGANVTYSSPLEGTDGAQRAARELLEKFPDKYFYPDQYNNPANALAHYRTTGPEIWEDTHGKVTHFVAGIGTGGTISGVGRYLKERNPAVQIIGVIPDNPLHAIEGLKHLPTAVRPGILDGSVIDRTVEAGTESALEMAQRLASVEGLFVGTSSGAAVHVALDIARSTEDAFVVTLLPDGGDRYGGDAHRGGPRA